jgi:hypothetical protein
MKSMKRGMSVRKRLEPWRILDASRQIGARRLKTHARHHADDRRVPPRLTMERLLDTVSARLEQ